MSNNPSCVERTEVGGRQGNTFIEFLSNGFEMNVDEQGKNRMGCKAVFNIGQRQEKEVVKGQYYADAWLLAKMGAMARSGELERKVREMSAKAKADGEQYADKEPYCIFDFPFRGTSTADLARQGRTRKDGCAESRKLGVYPSAKGGVIWRLDVQPGKDTPQGIITPLSSQERAKYKTWRTNHGLPAMDSECMQVRVMQTIDEFIGKIIWFDDVRLAYLNRQVAGGVFDFTK